MNRRLTHEERCYVASSMHVYHSTSQVRRLFQMNFNKSPPTHKTIYRIQEKFLHTGSIATRKHQRRRICTDEVSQIRVQAHFDQHPLSSIRQAARVLDLTYSSIRRCLKIMKMKPYRISNVHDLRPTDMPRRVEACSVLAEMVRIEPDIASRMVFSDEATFHLSGFVNSSTCRYWAYENPHAAIPVQQDPQKINVWCGLTSQCVIGPFFFAEETVQQWNYLDMLENFAVPIMVDQGITHNGYFMQDGAPPHWSIIVRDYLSEIFPGRWIGRDGPIAWPPRSPDLTPCDLFLWGFLKNAVYRRNVGSLQELKERISASVLEIGEPMLHSVFNEMIRRWHVCIERGGKQVEKHIIL